MSSFADALAQVRQQQAAGSAPDFSAALAQVRQQTPTPAQPAPAPDPHPYLHAAENYGAGILKGAGQLIGSLDNTRAGKFINSYGGLRSPQATQADTDAFTKLTTPHGTAQKLGAATENVAEGFALPEVKAALPLRLLAQAALGAGLSKAHGGSAMAGALGGAGAEAIGSGLRAVAPSLAEAGIGARAVDRAYGKTPGLALLNDTRGLRPAKIAASSRESLGRLNNEIEQMAAKGTAPASLQPAIGRLDTMISEVPENSPTELASLQRVRGGLTENVSGEPIPAEVSPARMLALKRGLRKEFSKYRGDPTFDASTASNASKAASRDLDAALDNALGPEFASKNQRISSLIDVNKLANRASRNAPLGQRVAGRLAAHTGALTGAGIGSALGYEKGGARGAAAGGIAGLMGPELLASRPALIGGARAAFSPITKRAIRGALIGGATAGTKP